MSTKQLSFDSDAFFGVLFQPAPDKLMQNSVVFFAKRWVLDPERRESIKKFELVKIFKVVSMSNPSVCKNSLNFDLLFYFYKQLDYSDGKGHARARFCPPVCKIIGHLQCPLCPGPIIYHNGHATICPCPMLE